MKTFIASFILTIATGSILAIPFYMNYQDFNSQIRNKQAPNAFVAQFANKALDRKVDNAWEQCKQDPSFDNCQFAVRYTLAGSPRIEIAGN